MIRTENITLTESLSSAHVSEGVLSSKAMKTSNKTNYSDGGVIK